MLYAPNGKKQMVKEHDTVHSTQYTVHSTQYTVHSTLSGRSTNQRSSMGSHSQSQNSIDDCMRILCDSFCSVR